VKPEDRVNILVVDDSPEKLLALSALLGELDENVVTATSGREALRQLLQRDFAVVLLDVNMPGMDGFETAALIRQRKSSEHTPIIFITSYGDETHAARGYSLGAVDYILAPADPDVLKTKVAVFVELFRKTDQVRVQARALGERARQLQRLTEASLAINSALSLDGMLQVVTSLARDILGAEQAVAVVAADQKWSAPKTGLSLSAEYEPLGERPVLRDRAALLALLSRTRFTLRLPRGTAGDFSWPDLFAPEGAVHRGWLAAPLAGRDGRNMGLLHLLDKRGGDFTSEDESIITQLAQMSAIAIENTLNAEARESNRLKDEFLTTLSHELRTPLSAILGWTTTLRSGRLDTARSEHGLEVIERNVRAQAKLIDDLLDVSRIITGKIRLALRPASLVAIIEAAMEAMRPAADAKEIEIRFDRAEPAGGDRVVGDPDRLQQIVWNLFSNAIKFTPPRGRVTVSLSRACGSFAIRVSDTGKGIRPEFLAHVFDRFRQGDSSTARAHGGLGIGLAIARHLAELHGGSIAAESPGENFGATFTIELPAVAVGIDALEGESKPAAETVAAVKGDTPDLSGVTALVVEDEADGMELLAETLRMAGAAVETAFSAAGALELLKRRPPDILVSDIGLPGIDGYALLESVRRLSAAQGGQVPALAVSAYVREEDRLRALASGFDGHLGKPFEPTDLLATVARLAARRAEGCVGKDPGGREESLREGGPPVRVLVVEDDKDSREGLRELLEVWGHSVEVAESGAEAIEKATSSRPEIALIDIGLPEMDGYQVALRIREAVGETPMFLIALTGHTGYEDRQRAFESGFNAHLSKPISTAKLAAVLTSRGPTLASAEPEKPGTAVM
jgi:CheY-like chemotaxis protein